MSLKVTRENNKLKIELPLERATPSKSGKTLLVASTRGLITTDVKFKGKPIVLVLNAFIYPQGQHQRSRAGANRDINEAEE
jgi:hypothetical protein